MRTKLPDAQPFSLKYKSKGVSEGSFPGCQSLRGLDDDGPSAGLKYSIDPSRQGAFALNDPPGDDALVVIDPVSTAPCHSIFDSLNHDDLI
jgi:hypothetical protein